MKKSKLIHLDSGSIGVVSCMRRSKKTGNCFYGDGLLPGCTGTCMYTSVPNFADLVLGGQYSVTGVIIDVESGKPIKGMPVSLIMPTRKRYRAQSDAGGKFKIVVTPDPRMKNRNRFRVALDFSRMETVPEAREIIMFGDFTETFRHAHPKVKRLRLSVSKFQGDTIHMK